MQLFKNYQISDGIISLEKSGDEYRLSMIDSMGTINTIDGQGGKLISMSVGTSISECNFDPGTSKPSDLLFPHSIHDTKNPF